MRLTIEVKRSEEDTCFVAKVVNKSLAAYGDTAGEAVEELVEVMSLLLPEELERMLEV